MAVSLTGYGRVFVSENSVLCRIFGTYVADTAVEWSQLHRCIHSMLVWGLNLGEYPRWELMHTCEIQDFVKHGFIIWILDRSCWWKDKIKMSSRYRFCVCVCVCVWGASDRFELSHCGVWFWILIIQQWWFTFQERRNFPISQIMIGFWGPSVMVMVFSS